MMFIKIITARHSDKRSISRTPILNVFILLLMFFASSSLSSAQTTLTIEGQEFHINGKPTYEGRFWKENKIEGLLMTSRMVQGIFDDLNPETVSKWAYPDGPWDPNRNTDEFIAAMPTWHSKGLLCVVLNLQGGSPEGYSKEQPWHNSALDADGSLRPMFMARLERIIERADQLGMVVMLGVFYFGQDERLQDEQAVKSAVKNTVDWIAKKKYSNVLLEIANEYGNKKYDHPIIRERPEELIVLAKEQVQKRKISLPVSISMNGGQVPGANIIELCDYVLLHGNGVKEATRMVQMIQTTRARMGATLKPIINNEDDRPWRNQGWASEGISNNFTACVKNYVSWGYFDFREKGEGNDEGYQVLPINWGISSERKKAFFDLTSEITGSKK